MAGILGTPGETLEGTSALRCPGWRSWCPFSHFRVALGHSGDWSKHKCGNSGPATTQGRQGWGSNGHLRVRACYSSPGTAELLIVSSPLRDFPPTQNPPGCWSLWTPRVFPSFLGPHLFKPLPLITAWPVKQLAPFQAFLHSDARLLEKQI